MFFEYSLAWRQKKVPIRFLSAGRHYTYMRLTFEIIEAVNQTSQLYSFADNRTPLDYGSLKFAGVKWNLFARSVFVDKGAAGVPLVHPLSHGRTRLHSTWHIF